MKKSPKPRRILSFVILLQNAHERSFAALSPVVDLAVDGPGVVLSLDFADDESHL